MRVTKKKKIIEHQFLLRPDLTIVNCYDGSPDLPLQFGMFLFTIETTEESGKNLEKMLQTAVDSTKKLIDMIDAHETK